MGGGGRGVLTSTAMLKSTMDTLVFRCQHTCTMVLPRCDAGLSGELGAAASSSDSASAVESSGHSGKVSKSLPRANSLADEEEEEEEERVRSSTMSDHFAVKVRFHFFVETSRHADCDFASRVNICI